MTVSAVGNSVWYSVHIIFIIITVLFHINLGVDLLNMFTKHEFNLKIFVSVGGSYDKLGISTVKCVVPLVDYSVVKVWILTLPYKSTQSFVEIFLSLKCTVFYYSTWYRIRRLQQTICTSTNWYLSKISINY